MGNKNSYVVKSLQMRNMIFIKGQTLLDLLINEENSIKK